MKIAVLFLLAAVESARAQASGGISGTITDSVNHRGLPGALVAAESGSRDLTGADGGFTLKDLPPGEVKLRVKAAGYRQLETSVQLAAGDLLKCSFELHPMARVAGKIYDKETGHSITRTVWLVSRQRQQTNAGGISFAQDHAGGFDIGSLEPGDYTLHIDSDEPAISYDPLEKAEPLSVYGAAQYPAAIHLAEGEQRFLDMPLSVVAAYSATGTIEFPPGFESVPLSIGYLANDRNFSRTLGKRRQGPFRIDGLIPGMYLIYAEAGEGAGRAYGSVQVNISDHDVDGLQVKLLPAVNITGTIRMDADDAPLPPNMSNYAAVLLPSDRATGRMIQLTLQDGGRFHAEGLAPGDYWPELSLPDGYALSQVLFGNVSTGNRPIALSDGALTFVLTKKLGMIAGTVRDRNQAAVKGVVVSLSPEFGNTGIKRGALSGEGGEFVFRNLAPGRYRIEGAPVTEVKAGETVSVTVASGPE